MTLISMVVIDLERLHGKEWEKLTQQYFKESEWPPLDAVSPVVENGEKGGN